MVRGKAILFMDIKNPEDRPAILDLVRREDACDYVAMYAFFPNDLKAYQGLPDWVQRHSIVPISEYGAFDDRREVWRSSIAAASKAYLQFHPLAFMIFLKNASFLSGSPMAGGIPLLVAPIYGLAGERDEGLGPRIEGSPRHTWDDLIDDGATGFMTNHPLQLLAYMRQSARYKRRWISEGGEGVQNKHITKD
jgi:hypothetical protein